MSLGVFNRSMWSVRNLASNYLGSTIIVAIAVFFRLAWIQNPQGLVFDEIFYQREAHGLMIAGYELKWPGPDEPQEVRLDNPEFSIHPPFGKWVIAFFMNLLGPMTTLGFRMGPALFGVLLVCAVMAVCFVITRNMLWANAAGLLLAVDSLAVSMSRIAMLDGIMATLIVVGFLFFVLHLRSRAAGKQFKYGFSWLLLSGCFLGLAIATKWSAVAFLGLFILIAVAAEWGVFREVKKAQAFSASIKSLFIIAQTCLTALATYVVSWAGWFNGTYSWGSYLSDYNKLTMPAALAWLPLDWHPFILHHIDMANSGAQAISDNVALSPAWQWPLMVTPSLFAYQELPAGTSNCISSGDCTLSWSTISNPLLWYPAVIATLFLTWTFFRSRSVFSAITVAGAVAAFIPWLFIQRDTYFFYTISGLPFIVIALVLVLSSWHEKSKSAAHQRRTDNTLKIYFGLAFAFGLYFVPMALHTPVPDWFWNSHIWIPTWGVEAFEHLK